jgi:protease PrsW
MFDLGLSIFLAALPAAVLLVWFYRQDRARPEPIGLLARSVLYGFVATIPAAALEYVLMRLGPREPRILANAFNAFIVAGLVEEGIKYFFVKRYLYRRPEFDERIDGIMYSACVSLGFAFAENILYGSGGSGVLLFRAFTAVPMHAAVTGILGYWIGRAKVEAVCTDGAPSSGGAPCAVRGLWEAVLFHGAYDFFLFTRSGWSFISLGVLAAAIIRLLYLVRDAKERDHAAGII